MEVFCKVSVGELVDKLSILFIKEKFIEDKDKLKHVTFEKEQLTKTLSNLKLKGIETYLNELKLINEQLWKIEDDIREKERLSQFDANFIDLARSVYITNDKRFDVKNRVNTKYKSGVVEVKSYEKY